MVIKEAIFKFPNVWEVTKSKVSYPKGSIHEHPIPTNPKNPEWYVKAYHQSPGKQKFLHDYADDLYKHGIIEDADKRCCITPALAVTKPGAPAGVFRFAQDFRAGNKFTLTDRHGLPRPIDVAYELSGAAHITEIDLASGYWNIWITKKDRYKTAFQLPDGRVYQWTRFPFGLDISGSVFCMIINQPRAGPT